MSQEPTDRVPATVRGVPWRVRTFSALSFPGYRYLWLGSLGASTSTWMEQVARPWLILELTGSAAALGLVLAARMVPLFLFGLLAGVVADRYDRRRILIICRSVTTSTHIATAVLIFSGVIQPWHVFALAFTTGTSMAFNQPARQALISSLVDKEHLTNAIALSNVVTNTMRIVGTAGAGILIAVIGLGNVYLLNGILYAWTVLMTLMIRVPSERQIVRVRESMWASFTEGLRYARQNHVALAAISLATSMYLFGLPYTSIFIPLFARDVFETGASGMAFLMTATGAGALVGALTIASMTSIRRRGYILIAGVTMFGAALILFSTVSWLNLIPLSYAVIAVVGLMGTSYMSLNNVVLLESSSGEMHGRIMSIVALDRGFVTLGGVIAGFLAAAVGPQVGLIVFGGLCILTATTVAILIPSLRRID